MYMYMVPLIPHGSFCPLGSFCTLDPSYFCPPPQVLSFPLGSSFPLEEGNEGGRVTTPTSNLVPNSQTFWRRVYVTLWNEKGGYMLKRIVKQVNCKHYRTMGIIQGKFLFEDMWCEFNKVLFFFQLDISILTVCDQWRFFEENLQHLGYFWIFVCLFFSVFLKEKNCYI